MLIPSWANSSGGSPYSFSKAHLAPLLSANHHSASRTLTTNQPSVTGVRPDPKSWSSASGTTRVLADLLGQPDEDPFGPPDVADSIYVFVLDEFADELRAMLAEPGERIVDVVDGEHDAEI